MSNTEQELCKVDGAKYLQAEASEQDLCARFGARLAEQVGEARLAGLEISLEIKKSGDIEAQLAGNEKTYPSVAVNVMDRALNLSDLDRLADAVAQVIVNN